MAEPDAFDPTHALDGWRVPAPAPVDLALAGLSSPQDAEPDLALPCLQAAAVEAEADGFDPTHALDGWQMPAPAPLDLQLRSLLRAGRPRPDEAKVAWLKARGYETLDIEDVELPESASDFAVLEASVLVIAPPPPEPVYPRGFAEADLLQEPVEPSIDTAAAAEPQPEPPAVDAPTLDFQASPPPTPDPRQVLQSLELPQVPPPSPAHKAPVLDIPAVTPAAEGHPRLLAAWQPQAWTALVRRLADASVEVRQAAGGSQVHHHAPQWLCALWPPLGDAPPLLARWPELAAVVDADSATQALRALLDDLPPDAELWRADLLDVDWALLAELVVRRDAALRPAQAAALRELAEQEREASLARIGAGYARQGRVMRRHS